MSIKSKDTASMNISGNAATATTLQTSRKINLTGSVTGSASFNGGGDCTISTTTNHTHNYLPLTGGRIDGVLNVKSTYDLGSYYSYNDGCLIEIGTASADTMVVIHVTGNSYSEDSPINSMYQFYDYQSSNIINYSGINIGVDLTGVMKVFHKDNKLYAWIVQYKQYCTLSFRIYSNKFNLTPKVSGSAMPTSGVTGLVEINPVNVSKSGHTHNYAGSSSAGGAATSANKLNTNAGSSTSPIYFSNGVPVACSYTLGKSVPSDAKFTDTVYTLPNATSSTLGGVKVGSNITVSSGTISLTKSNITTALGYTPPTSDTNTTYSAGTGLSLSSTTFSVKYGTSAGTACQGNDSRLSNSRPASDVYSWAKAASKPSYSWSEITSKPDLYKTARYSTTESGDYYKININSTIRWMIAFNVRVYKSYKYYDIRFSGYNYGDRYWYSAKASLIEGDDSITAYMGYDGVDDLWVAIPGGTYTGIEISDVVNGYNTISNRDNPSSLFTISPVSSLGGTTQATFTLYPPSKSDHTHSQFSTIDSRLSALESELSGVNTALTNLENVVG